MAFEVETKVLDVNPQEASSLLEKLKAKKILDTKLTVDWFGPIGEKPGDEKWYLRVRSSSNGEAEITWKGKSKVVGNSRKHQEINLPVPDHKKAGALLQALGLENYAHQEKLRVSWMYKNWRFDLDTYPSMPPYLEIEGKNDKHIKEAILLLGLQDHKTSSEGETKLIREFYGLDWNNMMFKKVLHFVQNE